MATDEEGWKSEYTDWWFEFLREKGGKGVSKDTWQMVRLAFSPESFIAIELKLPFLINSSWSSSDW